VRGHTKQLLVAHALILSWAQLSDYPDD
jgi:hypothetical protein